MFRDPKLDGAVQRPIETGLLAAPAIRRFARMKASLDWAKRGDPAALPQACPDGRRVADQRKRASGTVFSSPCSEPMYWAITFSSPWVKGAAMPPITALARPTCGLSLVW